METNMENKPLRVLSIFITIFIVSLSGLGKLYANDLVLSANGLSLSWESPDYPHQINVHRSGAEYITTLPGGTTEYTVSAAGDYFIVAATDEPWEDWVRSNDATAAEAVGTGGGCGAVPGYAELAAAMVAANERVNLTLNNEMWGTIVANDGTVCAVAATGQNNLQSQWLASRVISAQKANTANSLSLGATAGGANAGLALSTANLWAAVQPGGSLFGLQFSNPVNTEVAYRGSAQNFGTDADPMVGGRIGGVNVFGGGLALYDPAGNRVGAIGTSGDTSCRDHFVAWEARNILALDYVPAGVSGDGERPDNIIFDTTNAFGHPNCLDPDGELAWVPTAVPSQ